MEVSPRRRPRPLTLRSYPGDAYASFSIFGDTRGELVYGPLTDVDSPLGSAVTSPMGDVYRVGIDDVFMTDD